MIPKTIHYRWLGENLFSKETIKCIESWREYWTNYEIKEWNDDNFDIKICSYIQEDYKCKRWVFASDYARFKILVELIKNIDDMINQGNFMECEESDIMLVNSGLGLGTQIDLALYKEVLDYYSTPRFLNTDGSINTMTVV